MPPMRLRWQLTCASAICLRLPAVQVLMLALLCTVRGELPGAALVGQLRWLLPRSHVVDQDRAEGPLEPLDRKALLAEHRSTLRNLRQEAGSKLSDHELLAHFRAATLNGQSPAQRVKETAAWRHANGIDAKMCDQTWLEKERQLRRVLKCDQLGLDSYGRPIMVQRVGAWDIAAVEKAAENIDQFVILNAMVCERLLRVSRPGHAKDPRGIIVIMDMKGLAMSHLSTKMLFAFSSVAQTLRAFYPDMLAHIFIVNAPWLFSALKAAIDPLFTAKTLSHLHMSSCIPAELGSQKKHLPVELGGERHHAFPYDETVEPAL
eukprot:TRINITY_DN57668_c0_g1_i1.p1 TRINITY_DN57668_c0_g1~~TRINITY_DN57668_c0_g1_i1.p1  ORF type:complete len:319 (+),score=45.45 TRINITY_DN57668_c0_g1_i1:51-1007(+)